jgi:hypothetical protein
VNDIKLARDTERYYLIRGRKYDIGRIGAEIAFTIATRVLGLGDVVLSEPFKGGKDLYTKDREAVIQSRLLRRH